MPGMFERFAAALAVCLALPSFTFAAGDAWLIPPHKTSPHYLLAGTEKFQVRTKGRMLCYRFKRFFVLANDDTHEFQVRRRDTVDWEKACRWDASTAYWDMGRFATGNFFGLAEPFLYLDLGTSHHRALFVFSLESKTKVHQTTYWDPIILNDGKILLWQGYGPATKENCPKYFDSGQGAIESQAVLDLKTMKETPTGKTRCEIQE